MTLLDEITARYPLSKDCERYTFRNKDKVLFRIPRKDLAQARRFIFSISYAHSKAVVWEFYDDRTGCYEINLEDSRQDIMDADYFAYHATHIVNKDAILKNGIVRRKSDFFELWTKRILDIYGLTLKQVKTAPEDTWLSLLENQLRYYLKPGKTRSVSLAPMKDYAIQNSLAGYEFFVEALSSLENWRLGISTETEDAISQRMIGLRILGSRHVPIVVFRCKIGFYDHSSSAGPYSQGSRRVVNDIGMGEISDFGYKDLYEVRVPVIRPNQILDYEQIEKDYLEDYGSQKLKSPDQEPLFEKVLPNAILERLFPRIS